ncbi:MAG: DUF6655 family protein [Thermoguttaceae bacterium]
MRFCKATLVLCLAMFFGCGTTHWSDTRRTATEQLLISDALDRAVSQLDFRSIAGKQVYLDAAPVKYTTDAAYLVSTLRQHMLASGCILKDDRTSADYVVEVRAGAVGTDRRELLFGVPATKIPSMLPVPGMPASLPEMPLATKTEQRGIVKLALFAYNRKTGRPLWQSGSISVESTAKDLWLLGAGPFRRGTIYEGTEFAGKRIHIPLISKNKKAREKGLVSVADEAYFSEQQELVADADKPDAEQPDAKSAAPPSKTQVAQKKPSPEPTGKVVAASHTEPVVEPPKPEAAGPQLPAKEPTSPPPKTPPPKPAPSAGASTAKPFDAIIPAGYVNLPLPPRTPGQPSAPTNRSTSQGSPPRPPVPPMLLRQR